MWELVLVVNVLEFSCTLRSVWQSPSSLGTAHSSAECLPYTMGIEGIGDRGMERYTLILPLFVGRPQSASLSWSGSRQRLAHMQLLPGHSSCWFLSNNWIPKRRTRHGPLKESHEILGSESVAIRATS